VVVATLVVVVGGAVVVVVVGGAVVVVVVAGVLVVVVVSCAPAALEKSPSCSGTQTRRTNVSELLDNRGCTTPTLGGGRHRCP
jgi:hypothetical protein